MPNSRPAVSEIAGLTTLDKAYSQANFALRLPPDYGPPDEVYLQMIEEPGVDGQAVIIVWLDPARPGRERLRLYQIGIDYYGVKQAAVDSLAQTEVIGQDAFWIEGGHPIQWLDERSYFVASSVLVWTEGSITYRLESELSLEETVQIAESLEAASPGMRHLT